MSTSIVSWIPWVLAGFGLVILLRGLYTSVRFIPNDRIGVVEKLWSFSGSVRQGGFISLGGEAGFQPDVLRGGVHVLFPFQYRVHVAPLVTIPQGKIGYVFARGGAPLSPVQALASNKTAHDFQDAAGFLAADGQRGPQRNILREGTYAINLAQFVVVTADHIYFLPLNKDDAQVFHAMASVIAERQGFRPVVIRDNKDMIGVVTVHDGPALPPGEIIAPIVGTELYNHNTFQDPEVFLVADGLRGRQLQVLVEGTYYINRLFATVELIPKTIIEVGTVGVVVSYTGQFGIDLTGNDYKHGELVERGQRGVWSDPLLPGKYAFNLYAGRVVTVPTTNFILKWNRGEVGSHGYDANLAEVSLITKDAFEPTLPLSVVVHIDYRKAPLVVQRFGDIKRLVEQTLDPMVAAYFKNIAQTRTLIQLIRERAEIQSQSSMEMKAKFAHYNLELEEVLIGTPGTAGSDNDIEEILTQLRARQIAVEQVETYSRREQAAVKERELREAEARAKQQTFITESALSIEIQKNQGRAELERSLQQASQIRALAEAEAGKIKVIGDAEGDKAARIGIGQAIAIDEQVRAYGGPKFQLTQQVMNRFAEAVEHAGVELVPRVVVSGGQGGGANGQGAMAGQNLIETLLAMLLSEKMSDGVTEVIAKPRSAEATALRAKYVANLNSNS